MGRMIYFIPLDAFVKERDAWRVSVVKEGESGHYPTGTWPYTGGPGETMPLFWGPTYKEAVEAAFAMNEKMGVSREDTKRIVTESVMASIREGGSSR